MFQKMMLRALQLRLMARSAIARWHRDEEGAEFMEYIVVVGALLVLVAGLVWAFGSRVAELWSRAISLLR